MNYSTIPVRSFSWMKYGPNTGIPPKSSILPTKLNIFESKCPIAGKAFVFFQYSWLVVGLLHNTALIFYPFLPGTIPIYRKLQHLGEDFSHKIPGIFYLVVIMIITGLLLNILTGIERMKKNLMRLRNLFHATIFFMITDLYANGILVLNSDNGDSL